MGTMESRVRCRLIPSMSASDRIVLATVLARYMTAGPAAMRTACVSLVARLIRSPVRLREKKAASSASKWSKTRLRRSVSTRRESPFRIWRMPKRPTPPSSAAATLSPAYHATRRRPAPGRLSASMAMPISLGGSTANRLASTTKASPTRRRRR